MFHLSKILFRSSTRSKNDNQPQVEISESHEDEISLFERSCFKNIRNSFKSNQRKILGNCIKKTYIFKNVENTIIFIL